VVKKRKIKHNVKVDFKETVLKEIVSEWIHLAQLRDQCLLWTLLRNFGCCSWALHAVFGVCRLCVLDIVTNFVIYLIQKLFFSLETL